MQELRYVTILKMCDEYIISVICNGGDICNGKSCPFYLTWEVFLL